MSPPPVLVRRRFFSGSAGVGCLCGFRLHVHFTVAHLLSIGLKRLFTCVLIHGDLIADCLSSRFEGDVLRPSESADFSAAVALARGCNNCSPSKPAVVLVPSHAQDVCLAMQFAAEGVRRSVWDGDTPPLAVCGGGHSELCVVNGGILLHLKRLNAVACDPRAGTVTAGGGATFGHIMEATTEHGLVAPTGTYPTVGVGALIGGGVGRLTRSCGLSVDNLVGCDLALPDGSLRSLRAGGAPEDEELLWAVRGCGCQFGVVTSVTLRAFPVSGARYGCGRAAVLTLAAANEGAAGPASSAGADDVAAALPALIRAEAAARALPANQSVDMVLGCAPPGVGMPPALMLVTMPCVLLLQLAESTGTQSDAGGASSSPAAAAEDLGPEARWALNVPLDSPMPAGAYWPIPFHPLTAPPGEDAAAGGPSPPEEEEAAASSTASSTASSAVASAAASASASASAQEVASTELLQTSDAVRSYVRQIFVDDLGGAGWAILARAALSAPSPLCSIVLQHGGGACRVACGDASFGCRRWEYSVLFMALWAPPQEQHEGDEGRGGEEQGRETPADSVDDEARSANMAWADGGWQELVRAGLATGAYAVDINPFRRPGTAAEEVELAFGRERLERLRALKCAVDPQNLLRSSWPLLAATV